jgi:hypothetical protein
LGFGWLPTTPTERANTPYLDGATFKVGWQGHAILEQRNGRPAVAAARLPLAARTNSNRLYSPRRLATATEVAKSKMSMRQFPATSFILAIAVAVVPIRPGKKSQVLPRSYQPTRVSGLVVTGARRRTVEGKDGIEITFNRTSAERLLGFTHGTVGRRMIFFLNRKKIATLRLLDPIEDGNVLLTGDLDSTLVNRLFSGGAVIDVALE